MDGTLTITLADQSTTSVTVKNGRGITSVAKTGTSGLNDTYTISYNDGTTSTFVVKNGAKGDTGAAWYVWIRYAGQQPTQDSDMGTDPDNWMGIYSGTSATPPTHYTSYTWFEIKGETGDTGAAASIISSAVEYQTSNSGTVVPSGTWTSTVPTVVQGQFLWTRTTVEFNSGSPIVWYAVAYQAVDGEGSPGSTTPLADSSTGVVGTAISYSREDHQHPLQVATSGTPQMDGTASLGTATTYARTDHRHPKDTSKQDLLVSGTNIKTVGGQSLLGSGNIDAGGALYFTSVAVSATTGDIVTVSNAAITADHVVASVVFANSNYITTDVSWITSSGSLVLNGTCSTATTCDIVLVKKNN